jgi:hypothetical protein
VVIFHEFEPLHVVVGRGSWWLFPKLGFVGLTARDYLGNILVSVTFHIHVKWKIYIVYGFTDFVLTFIICKQFFVVLIQL